MINLRSLADNTFARLPVEQLEEGGHIKAKEIIESALIEVWNEAIEEAIKVVNNVEISAEHSNRTVYMARLVAEMNVLKKKGTE